MQTIDLSNLKDVEEGTEIEIFDGIAVRGKIESYGNAGMMEDPVSKEEQKVCIIQISVVIPQSDVQRFIMMEDDNNLVQMLIQPVGTRKQSLEKYST